MILLIFNAKSMNILAWATGADGRFWLAGPPVPMAGFGLRACES